MKDKFDIFGQLPDTLSDDWIDDEQGLERELRKFVEGRQRANAFDIRWGNTATGVSMSAEEREWQRGWQTWRRSFRCSTQRRTACRYQAVREEHERTTRPERRDSCLQRGDCRAKENRQCDVTHASKSTSRTRRYGHH